MDNNEGVIISITLSLFMLSLITEKVSNFIKLYFPSLALKNNDDAMSEKIRERRISILTGVIGILIALICNADFFKMIQNKGIIEPLQSIRDMNLKGILGCLVSGLFLSQGSKFFHDLLDTLLYYKNVKKHFITKMK